MILYIKATTKRSSQVFKLFKLNCSEYLALPRMAVILSFTISSSAIFGISSSSFQPEVKKKKKKRLQKPCQQVVDILRLHQVSPASLDSYDSMLPRIILLHMSQQTSSMGPFLHALTYTQVSIQQAFSCLSQNGLTKAQPLLRQRCLIVVLHG